MLILNYSELTDAQLIDSRTKLKNYDRLNQQVLAVAMSQELFRRINSDQYSDELLEAWVELAEDMFGLGIDVITPHHPLHQYLVKF